MRRRAAVTSSVAAVLAGSAVAISVPLVWRDSTVTAKVFAAGTAGQLAAAGRSDDAPPPAAQPREGQPAAVPPSAPPVKISFAPRVNTRVVPVGVNSSGAVAVPDDVNTVGWYRWSAKPGARQGSVVLVGHVDSALQGAGAFFRLHTLGAGDRISVTTNVGEYTYRVVSREDFPKATAPLDELFSTAGAPRLELITCGGPFDPTTGSYRDNVVVTAVPVGGAGRSAGSS
jgi:hypothetical protein